MTAWAGRMQSERKRCQHASGLGSWPVISAIELNLPMADRFLGPTERASKEKSGEVGSTCKKGKRGPEVPLTLMLLTLFLYAQ